MPHDALPSPGLSPTLTRRRAVLGLGGGVAAGLLGATGAALTHAAGDHESHLVATPTAAEPQMREFTLTAEEFDWELMPGVTTRAWGYNGQVPGPEIRVTEGDTLRVTLKNALSVPTTIHWHGLHLPPAMDGPAGLNQAAVQPGDEFVYEFVAQPAGTRWYHSHADPALQVPMGLYGPLIIEPREPGPAHDREYTLMLAEWDSELTPDVAAGRAERGPKDRMLRGGELGADMFLINGRAHGAIPPIVVAEGEKVLIRIINAGHLAHPIHGHGHSFRLIATDGNSVPELAQWVKDTFLVGPAERMDLSFDAVHPGVWMFHCHIEHHMANGMMTVIQYEGHQPTGPAAELMDETITHDDHGSHGEHGDHGEDDPTPEATVAPAEAATEQASGDEVVVRLVDDRFDPYEIEVPAGTTVRWVNKGSDWHNVASSAAGFASDRIAPGESFAYTFDKPGTYKIVCRHHGLAGMNAVVTVT